MVREFIYYSTYRDLVSCVAVEYSILNSAMGEKKGWIANHGQQEPG